MVMPPPRYFQLVRTSTPSTDQCKCSMLDGVCLRQLLGEGKRCGMSLRDFVSEIGFVLVPV